MLEYLDRFVASLHRQAAEATSHHVRAEILDDILVAWRIGEDHTEPGLAFDEAAVGSLLAMAVRAISRK
ncbi:MAG: hypothetical protein K8M05_25020 [Deltaproteobacteria bacterium]|nr:hypothetical protein [Kofleriaceae bacterium]